MSDCTAYPQLPEQWCQWCEKMVNPLISHSCRAVPLIWIYP